MEQVNGNFYAAAVGPIANGAPHLTDSRDLLVPDDVNEIQVQGFGAPALVDAGEDAVFHIVRSIDGTNFSTGVIRHQVAINASAFEGLGLPIDMKGYKAVRITEIENTDAVTDITGVNIRWAYVRDT